MSCRGESLELDYLTKWLRISVVVNSTFLVVMVSLGLVFEMTIAFCFPCVLLTRNVHPIQIPNVLDVEVLRY